MNAHTHADLTWLIRYAPDLAEARRPGSRRPWRPSSHRPVPADPLEALRRSGGVPASPAPLYVDLLDLAVDLQHDAMTGARLLAHTTGQPPPPDPCSHYADPRPALSYLDTHLDDCPEPETADWIATVAARHVRAIANALALILDGQRLTALCPWCDGRDEHHPTGGGHTLVVRLLQHMRDAHGHQLPAVICYGHCDPPTADCGTRYRGHPVWPEHEWTWLADRIQHADQSRVDSTPIAS